MNIACLDVNDGFLDAFTAIEGLVTSVDSNPNISNEERENLQHKVPHEQLVALAEGAVTMGLRYALSKLFGLFESDDHSAAATVSSYVEKGLVLGQIVIKKWYTSTHLGNNYQQDDPRAAEEDRITWQDVNGVNPELLAELVRAAGGQERYAALRKTFLHTVQLAIAYKYVCSSGCELDEARHTQRLVMAQLRLVASAVSDTLQVKSWTEESKWNRSERADSQDKPQNLCIYEADALNNAVMGHGQEQVEHTQAFLDKLRVQSGGDPTQRTRFVSQTKAELVEQKRACVRKFNQGIQTVVRTGVTPFRHSPKALYPWPTPSTDPSAASPLARLCDQMCALQKSRGGGAVTGLLSNGVGGTVVLLREETPGAVPGHHFVRFPEARSVADSFHYYLLTCVYTAEQLGTMFPRPPRADPPGEESSAVGETSDRAGARHDRKRKRAVSGDRKPNPRGEYQPKGCNTYGNIGSVFLQPASVSLSEDEMQYEDHQAALRWRRGEVEES